MILIVIFVLGFIAKLEDEGALEIIISSTEAKYEPREESTTYFSLTEGIKVKILEKTSDWCKVERLDGKTGWVKKQVLENI